MKKSILVTLLVSSLVFLSGVRGVAGTLWDVDGFFPPKYLSGENTKYTDYFNITSKYNPALEKITFAKLWVAVSDDQIWPDSYERVEGDFLFWGAKLLVETCPKSVPDGGATLMLLGAALAGIESLRRRTTRRNLQ
jgi:hypothetical protein